MHFFYTSITTEPGLLKIHQAKTLQAWSEIWGTETDADHQNIVTILAGCEAGLLSEKARGTGKKAHAAGRTLDRDDSAMEEAWVCSIPALAYCGLLKMHATLGGSSMSITV